MKNFILFTGILAMLLFGCRREEFIAQGGVSLAFSKDTVFLDTVFTTVGSSTYNLKVYNPSDETVNVDNIRLGDPSGCYRMNVNGEPGKDVKDVQILPRDSIYVFVEVTHIDCADRQGQNTYLYHDSIIFSNKGTTQSVDLITTVRDAYFHFPTNYVQVGNTVIPYSEIDGDQTWPCDKPHVVYGYGLVSGTLRIDKGTEVYFHQNSGLWIYDEGTLRVGESECFSNPNLSPPDSVIFAGDRLEPFYEDVPGQWGGPLGGIFLQGRSVNNSIGNAVIKNATTALRLDSTLVKNLDISNTYILNSSRTGIFGGYGNMDATNLVVANAGVHLFYAFGGDYEFRHCTFANYWDQSTRSTAAVALTNYFDTQTPNGSNIRLVRDLTNAYFGNCIVSGNNRQELAILKDDAGSLDYYFNHALLSLSSDPNDRNFDINDPAFFNNIQVNADPDFVNTAMNRYALDSASQAVNQGNLSDGLLIPSNTDILGRNRNFGSIPDLGAFERQY